MSTTRLIVGFILASIIEGSFMAALLQDDTIRNTPYVVATATIVSAIGVYGGILAIMNWIFKGDSFS